MAATAGDLHRVAVVSDVHGNVTAYEAVLADIAHRGIEYVVNLGDLIGKGPRGSECIRMTRERAIPTVRGNWDTFIARDTVQPWEHGQWVRDTLSEDERHWLATLPNVHEIVLSGQPIRFFHASPVSEFHRVFAPTTEEEHRAFVAQTAFTGDGPVPTIVGYGDIHGAYLAVDYGITVFNAGSVGNALDGPGAPYVVLEGALPRADLDEPAGHVGITFVRVPYDVEAEVAVAEELGMPGADAYALELREQRYRGSAVPAT
ncbi:phosphoesterase [Terrabacter sp. Root85]|uniref:metallophosphoesterase family protein n=1 Tax=Terrabacter sp. Root85 TaxID=1736603 RepID=UPI0006FE0BDC|nr:metallophosphoesterase family protein [Terrabacter sp. Root85]KRC89842.1 phosphoesterase [Terrabacter sp. Root85]